MRQIIFVSQVALQRRNVNILARPLLPTSGKFPFSGNFPGPSLPNTKPHSCDLVIIYSAGPCPHTSLAWTLLSIFSHMRSCYQQLNSLCRCHGCFFAGGEEVIGNAGNRGSAQAFSLSLSQTCGPLKTRGSPDLQPKWLQVPVKRPSSSLSYHARFFCHTVVICDLVIIKSPDSSNLKSLKAGRKR